MKGGTLHPKFIVGIGGSAGGLPEYMALLDALPANTGMAFVIACHLMPTASSQLAEILRLRTKMKVLVASDAMPIKPNHVYVIPPNADLLIEGETLKVVSPRTMEKFRHKQVDLLLTSLAESAGKRAIGIIFSGSDGDGTEGVKKIKAKGGTTFAQDSSAEVKDMPLGAEASGCVDFVLPTIKIAAELLRISKSLGHR